MMRRPGQILSRFELLEHAWNYEYENRSNVVDSYIRFLRRKIDKPFGTDSIETVRGAGYRLREDAEALSRIPIRVRVTLAFAVAMALVLGAAGLFIYSRLDDQLNDSIDNGLRSRAGDVAALVEGASGGLGQVEQALADRARRELRRSCSRPAGKVVDSTPQLEGTPVLDPRPS